MCSFAVRLAGRFAIGLLGNRRFSQTFLLRGTSVPRPPPVRFRPRLRCALGRNRTCDLLDRNQTLYPLSYKRELYLVSLKEIAQYVNDAFLMFLFGEVAQKDVPDFCWIHIAEGNFDVGEYFRLGV